MRATVFFHDSFWCYVMGNMNDDPDKSGSEPEDPSELQNLANSLAASEEAMGVSGSALAGHVVGALQAQGLVSTQSGG